MQTFNKSERLCGKKIIDELFADGDGFFAYPFKIIWIKKADENSQPAKVLITVSKRNFKKAVDRNKIKRLIREVYRKNKYILYERLNDSNFNINFAIIYTAKQIIQYSELEVKIINMLNRLILEYEKTTC